MSEFQEGSREKEILISAKDIRKEFVRGRQTLEILKGVDLDVYKGEALCIVGSSGAGKSTLLNILGTLDRPTNGQLFFEGVNLLNQTESRLAHFRNTEMGFVFQFHHLLSEFSALENVMMPAKISGNLSESAKSRALELLDFLGLADRVSHYPSEMSGGEQQRVAIARALMQNPKVLFADEPTGNLDSQNSRMIEDYFFQLREKWGLTLVVVTHDENMSEHFERRLLLNDGHWAS